MTQPPNRWEEPAVSIWAIYPKRQQLESEPGSSVRAAVTTTRLSLLELGRDSRESSGFGNQLVTGRLWFTGEGRTSKQQSGGKSLTLAWGGSSPESRFMRPLKASLGCKSQKSLASLHGAQEVSGPLRRVLSEKSPGQDGAALD